MDPDQERLVVLSIEELGGRVIALTDAVLALKAALDEMTLMYRAQTEIALDARRDALRAREELQLSREAFDEERREARRERPTDPDMSRRT